LSIFHLALAWHALHRASAIAASPEHLILEMFLHIFLFLSTSLHSLLVGGQNVSAPSHTPTFKPTVRPSRAPVAPVVTFSPSLMPTQISASPTQPTNYCPNFPTSELSPLEDFYYSTGGPNWRYTDGDLQPWNFSTPNPNPCSEEWQFIRCAKCSVIEIIINDANLAGSLPNSIGQLKFLKVKRRTLN
jgi:hypothetical protein